MRKFIKMTIIYSFLVLFLGNLIAFLGNYFLQKSQFYKTTFLVNAFKEKNKFDYFIVGSSRGLTTLNTNQIDTIIKTTGINLSMDDTDLKTQFLMIKHFFDSGFTSKYCILSLDDSHFIRTKTTLGNNDYRFVPFSDRNYVKKHYSKYDKSSLGILKFSNINPFFTYSYYNLELLLPAVLSMVKPKFKNKFDAKGNYSYPVLGKYINNKNVEQKKIVLSNPLLKEISTFLKKKNCHLIIYIPPYADRDYKLMNEENYIIINHSSFLKNSGFFYDKIHVNRNGRVKSTEYFIKSLKELF